MKESMRCPVCRRELVEYKMLPLQTLDEYIMGCENPCPKMAYRCPNSISCRTYGTKDKPVVFWNENGECYGRLPTIFFIDGNDAPFGTFQRQLNIEIYKKDENKLILVLPRWLPSVLSGMRIYQRWNYKANEEGEILSRKLSFDYLTKEGVYHNWGVNMLTFCLKRTWKAWKKGNRQHLNDSIQQSTWPRCEWWRKVNAKAASLALKNLGETA